MIYRTAFVLLGPVLYAQGKFVRRVTPRLPEPEGLRTGYSGEGEQLQLLITGDSAAAGVGVTHQDEALSGRLVSALSSTHAVSWQLLAKSGDTSSQLLKKLEQAPTAAFESVVISIGVNDVTGLVRSKRWVKNLSAIIELLRTKFSAQQIYLSSVPPMHYFPALPNPLRWWLGLRAKRFNRLMERLATTEHGCTFVKIPYPADRSYIADDGFHPGRHAYKLWGEHVAKIIRDESNLIPRPAQIAKTAPMV